VAATALNIDFEVRNAEDVKLKAQRYCHFFSVRFREFDDIPGNHRVYRHSRFARSVAGSKASWHIRTIGQWVKRFKPESSGLY